MRKILILGLLMISIYSCKKQITIYEWRGPNRSGVYNETGLLKAWPEEGPELLWEYEGIGNGFGSPVFSNDNMYVLGEVDSLAYLFAFDMKGNLLWKKDFGKDWTSHFPGSRSTPTVVDELVYVTSGSGIICCFNSYTGEKIWSVDMMNDLNGSCPVFGFAESVAVQNDKLFCTPGGKDTNVVALNRFNGEITWISKGKGNRPAYNSPLIIELENIDLLVTFTAYEMLAHNAETGELLWAHEQDNTKPEERQPGVGDTHSNTVIYDNEFIYYAEGDGNCGVKLELSKDGKSIKELWRNPGFDSYMGGIVKIGDYLYGCGTRKKDLRSLNINNGEILDTLKIGSGAVIAADSMLYYYNHSGKVMLITPDPGNMKGVSEFKITKGTNEPFAHPVIHDGILYVRHGNVIQAFNIKKT